MGYGNATLISLPDGRECLGRRRSDMEGSGTAAGFVQAFVAQSAVEWFYEPVPLRLARRHVMPCHAEAVAPIRHGAPHHLRAVVADDRQREATAGKQCLELPHKAPSADRGVHQQRQSFAGICVDDAQDAER